MVSITTDLFAALNILVMNRSKDNYFKLIGTVPRWFLQFYPDAILQRDKFLFGEKFLFLENFLIDAEVAWQENQPELLKSGLWLETDVIGDEYYLEAAAIKLNHQDILLVSLGEIGVSEKKLLIQTGRENNLRYYQLLKEIQKKEVLIHCIVHDLASPLTGIKYSFDLLSLQDLSPKAREYLEIGKQQSNNQEIMIREILEAFSAEVEFLNNYNRTPEQSVDALRCTRDVINTFIPIFSRQQINLRLYPDVDLTVNWCVVGEQSRLERVLYNLIENALRYSPVNSTVTVKLQQDGALVLFTVDDEGSGVPPEVAKTLFQKFTQGKNKVGKIGLGLYFCRITVERWGGEIGYSALTNGGSRFWFRLPQPGIRSE